MLMRERVDAKEMEADQGVPMRFKREKVNRGERVEVDEVQ